jgi:thiazole synthase ThiGH ThiG subunit
MGHINRFNLQNLIEEFQIKIFFETGTGMGSSITHALNLNFKELYTI